MLWIWGISTIVQVAVGTRTGFSEFRVFVAIACALGFARRFCELWRNAP